MKRRVRREPIAEINVVPYIDVMLVLLVIFMVTTPLLSQGVKVELPKTQAKALDAKQKQPIIVTVDDKGQYYLNVASKPDQPQNQVVLVNRVAAELRLAQQASQPRQVLVKGDTHVDYGSVVKVMGLLQQAGAETVGLLTTPTEETQG